MTVSGKDRRGLVEEIRTLQTHLDALERRKAELLQAQLAERLKTQSTLTTSELQYRATLDSMGDAIHVVDSDLRIVLLNERFRQWGAELGLDVAHAVGRTLFELFPFLPETIRDEYRRVFEDGRVLTTEEVTRIAGGEIVTETRKIPIRQEGRVVRVITVVRDITNRKYADEALRQRELSLNLALQVADLGHWDRDIRSGRTECSDEIYRIFDVRPEEVQFTYERFLEFVHPSDRESVKAETQAMREGNRLFDMEFRIITPKRRERTIHSRAAVFKNQMGEPVRVIGTVQDITERKVAERQIRERARIIDSMADSVIKTDRDGVVTMWNRGAERIFGYTSEEMIGQPISTLYSKQEQGRLAEIIQTLLRGEEIATTEVTCVHKNGSLVELALSLLPFKDDRGNVTEFVGISKDITERKRTQEALRQSENRYRTVIENAGEGIVVVQDGKLRFVNSRHTFVTGRSPEESTSRPFVEFIHPDDRKRVAEIHAARLRGEPIPRIYEFRIIDKDGQTKWLENNGVVIEWDGRPASLNFLQDISDRKKAEEEKSRLLKAIETAKESISITTPDGIMVYANEAMDNLFGYERGELIGQHISVLTSGPGAKDMVREALTALAQEGRWEGEVVNRKKDGTEFITYATTSAVKDEKGNIINFIGTQHDITERKKAEKALKTSEERFRLAQQASQTGVWERNLKTDEVYWSQNVESMFGLKPGSFNQNFEAFFECVLPEDRKRIGPEVSAAIKKGRGFTIEYRVALPDGGICWMTEDAQLFNDLEGKPTRLVGTVRDITERKRAQEAIQRQTELLDSIRRAQTLYITEYDSQDVFGTLLETLVKITGSEYGFIDEVRREEDGRLFKKSLALSNISWDEESGQLYEKLRASNMEFRDLNNLAGAPARTGELVISNDPARDSHSGGLPKGHPAIRSFMGIPMYFGGELVGVAGVANRQGGYDEQMASFLETFISTCAGVIHAVRENRKERQMAESLQEKARLQQTLLDSMPCVALLMRPGSRHIVASNKAAAEVGAVPGKTCYQTWAGSDSPCPWCLAPEVWATGQAQHCEPAGGGKVWDAHWIPVSDDLYMHYAFDITERRQAEKALRETTVLLETIFAHTHILVAYLDPQFNFVRVNRAYAEIDGREPSGFVGRNHFDLYPNAENEAIFRKVVEIGVPYFAHAKPFEYTGHPERPVTYWDWSLVPIKEQDGAVCGLVLTLANVTEQKRAEQALRESEGHYRSLAKLSPVGIFRTDMGGDCTYVNERWCEIAGMSPEEAIGGGWAKAVHPDDREHVCDQWYQSVREQRPFRMEYRFRCPDGAVTWVQGQATGERDIDGHIVGYVGTTSDITELKRAEQTLREREATLTSIFRTAPVGIGLERDRVLVRVNDKICEMLGYGRDELVGRHAKMFYPSEEEYQRLREEKRRQIRERGTSTVETQWKRKDGRIIDVLLSTTVLDPADFAKGVTFTALDITERKRAEEAIRESEEKFRTLAEQSPNMIFINKKGRIVYANKKCEEIMGYTREEFCSPDFNFLTLVAPESVDVIKESFAKHLRNQDVEPYDYCLINRAGERIEAINASKLIQYEGETAILGIVTDITEHKRAERELRESQERFRMLFESAPDAIYLMDLEGRFVDGNKVAEEMVGFTKTELVGKSLAESGLLSAEDLSKAVVNLRKTAAGQSPPPTEYTVRRKSGSLITVEIRTFPVRIGGKILCLGIARDITERKGAQQKLLDDREQLKSLASQLSLTEERERRRLAIVLHDHIGQSLVFSKIKLDQMRKSESAGELTEAIKDVSRCLERVIQDTRTLTFDLSDPILYELGFEAAVAEWLTEQVQDKHGIETEFQDDGQAKPLDDDIRALLFRNVREVLINIIKHAQARHVKVAVGKADRNICICVKDDGVGFDPVEAAATAVKKAEFGLFSIRERLEQLGGRVEIESKPGRGTKITMTAPLKYEQANDRIER